MAHGANQFAIAKSMIAGELDAPDLNLGTFLDLENQDYGVT